MKLITPKYSNLSLTIRRASDAISRACVGVDRLIRMRMHAAMRGFAAFGIAAALVSTGCQQAGGPGGSSGIAPITQLPGQTPIAGPTLPALGPFGASARVPPPATGSYGSPNVLAGSTYNNTPANYAPSGLQQMSYNDQGGNQIAVAGGVPSSPSDTPVGSGWMETSTNQNLAINPQMDLSGSNLGLRMGGMPVNDLTNAPAPPGYRGTVGFNNQSGQFNTPSYQPAPSIQGYQPQTNLPGQYPATQLMPQSNYGSDGFAPQASNPQVQQFNTPIMTQPISGGGLAESAPAANQPAFSSADRPVQWQTPRR
ncbi:hypothetical protein [Aporhodopirellula aestuarii]|uniref:Secreted protein n=1 Tax=Aporhodopirellula aestuarii TaxID=2950107 RepID=A0ABT0U936_9BACT|nr:hypothetical protein [Aporhodopirellula aestuarii]MCM2372866.1 hypothetical protein [Aporhodopirellula aestuarii]